MRKKHDNLKLKQELILINSTEDINEQKKIIRKILNTDIKVIAKNESQKKLIKSIKNNEITICAGPAGTGKTFVALAFALNLLKKTTNRYKRIYLVKSVTTLKGEEIGFLKGDLMDKIEPFMWSFYFNMEKFLSKSTITDLINNDILRPFPLAYIRGATLDDCIIIADEMQNVSINNSRTLLTRIGNNAKIIVLGDVNQIDMKKRNESSLGTLLHLFDDVEKIGVVEMNENDTNVRNPIITEIEKKYNELLRKETDELIQQFSRNNGRLK